VGRGIARNLLLGAKEGVWGWKSPSVVQEQRPGEGLGACPQKLETKCNF